MPSWVWLVLFVLVVTAQVVGMRTGNPLSRVVHRLTERSRAASMGIAAVVVWLPVHWIEGSATDVSIWDGIAVAAGLLIGYFVHERRKRKKATS